MLIPQTAPKYRDGSLRPIIVVKPRAGDPDLQKNHEAIELERAVIVLEQQRHRILDPLVVPEALTEERQRDLSRTESNFDHFFGIVVAHANGAEPIAVAGRPTGNSEACGHILPWRAKPEWKRTDIRIDIELWKLHDLPNVKDQPHVCLARAVRKHRT